MKTFSNRARARARGLTRKVTPYGGILTILIVMAAVLLCSQAFAAVCYVKTTGNDANSGDTWALAKKTIQAAITARPATDDIWVAGGTYQERITLKSEQKIYGGLHDGDTDLAQRDLVNNPTTIDAYLLGVAVTVPAAASATTTIDGLTIRNGKAANGGGILCNSAGLTVANCVIRNNQATGNGGGIHCSTGTLTVTNTTFLSNTANYGGGIYFASTSPAVSGCTFTSNTANYGGAMYLKASSSAVSNCAFETNSANSNGGGVYMDDQGSPSFSACAFTGNTASNGGAIYSYDCSPAATGSQFTSNTAGTSGGAIVLVYRLGSVSGCTFTGNSADTGTNAYGGAIYLNSSSATVSGNSLSGNRAYNGAGIACNSSSPIVHSNALWANVATNVGGGIFLTNVSSSKCVNNTIADCFAANGGGGIYTNAVTSTAVHNNIVAFNASGIRVDGAAPTLKYNCVYGCDAYPYMGVSDPTGSDGNIAADPLLADYSAGDLHIQPGSPCIDTGDASVVLGGWTDLDGQARTQGAQVDIGADESNGDTHPSAPPSRIIYVTTTGSDAASGLSWGEAKLTIQNAINTAVAGDEVWVAAGTYVETITMKKRVALYGGFNGTELLRTDRNVSTNTTTIDGNLLGTVVRVPVGAFGSTTLDGFNVRNGLATSVTSNDGGALHCAIASINLANCTIRSSSAPRYGGGAFFDYSPSVLTNNSFRYCSSTSYGGGIYASNASLSISATLFTNCTGSQGGGIYLSNSSSAISGCTFTTNGSGTPNTSYGGAIRIDGGSASIGSTTFTSNSATNNGGALYFESWSGTVTGCTFGMNAAASHGGGAHLYSCSGTIANSSFSQNTANVGSGYGGGIYVVYGTPSIVANSFTENRAFGGAALYGNSAQMIAYDNTMRANVATHVGAGVYLTSVSNTKFVNNTIADNYAANGGAGIFTNAVTTASTIIGNNIIAFNASGIRVDGTGPTIRYNDVFGNDALPYMGIGNQTGSNGNIAVDPLLASVPGGNLHIQPASPCIDAGDDAAVLTVWKDMDGQDRIIGTKVDIGADESDGTTWAGPPASKIIRVRSTATNDTQDGSTWAKAKKTIQGAINAASWGDEIWVAAGTYVETITMKKRVAIYGGFLGTTETLRTQRNWTTNLTTINANLTGTAVTVPVGCFGSTTLDGFTVRNGQAASGAYGGALYCYSATINLANCSFKNSNATRGGGVYLDYSPSVTTGNLFQSCQATQAGGGLWVSNAPATVASTLFTSNQAPSGAGLYFDASSSTLTGCTFNTNAATSNGGGAFFNGSAPSVTNCVFSSNTANYGAGFYAQSTSGPISGNTASGNTANNSGGGAYIEGTSGPFFGNTLTGNTATNSNGGGVYLYSGSPAVYQNTFALNRANNGAGLFCQYGSEAVYDNMFRANIATNVGGGVHLSDVSSVKCVNNTIADNFAANGGAGIYTNNCSSTMVHNNIIAFNASGIRVNGNAPTIKYNCVYGNDALPYYGIADQTGINGNIDADPLLANLAGGNTHVQPGSPCVDAGDEAAVLSIMKDFDNQDRILGVTVDIGADEADGTTWPGPPASKIIYVKKTGNDGNTGLSWAQAKLTIQAAINTATDNDEVWVAAGTYQESITLKKRVGVFGGFVGTEASKESRSWLANPTIIDGNNAATAVNVAVGSLGSTALDGFTITRGKTAGNGGGMLCSVASVQTANNTFSANSAAYGGGALFDWSPSVLTNNTFQSNSATQQGGGIYASNASPTIQTTTFGANTAPNGGGVYLASSSALIQSCTFKLNRATSGTGGGLYATNNAPSILDSSFTGNSATSSGGGIYCGTASGTLVEGNTVSGNSAQYGGGIYFSSPGTLYHNVITGNTATTGGATGGGVYLEGNSPTVSTNQVVGNSAGKGAGIYCYYGTPRIYDNVLRANSAAAKGGALMLDASSAAFVVNNTSAANQAATGGAGLYLKSVSGATRIENNIVAFNQSGVLLEGGSFTPKNNCVHGNTAYAYSGMADPTGSNGNINTDPKLADLPGGNVHIQPTSPCLDAGNDDAVLTILYDLDGEDRIQGLRTDIGADESDGTVWPGESDDIMTAKSTLADGEAVAINGLPVTASFADYAMIYIEKTDRTAGIRVFTFSSFVPGEIISLLGTMQTDFTTGERYIMPDGGWPKSTGGFMPMEPLGLNLKALGGGDSGLQPGIPGAAGLNNIGLLVTVWGNVTEIDSSLLPTWFVISDGAVSTKVMLPAGVPVPAAIGDTVSATGISTCENLGSGLTGLLMTRTADDIIRR